MSKWHSNGNDNFLQGKICNNSLFVLLYWKVINSSGLLITVISNSCPVYEGHQISFKGYTWLRLRAFPCFYWLYKKHAVNLIIRLLLNHQFLKFFCLLIKSTQKNCVLEMKLKLFFAILSLFSWELFIKFPTFLPRLTTPLYFNIFYGILLICEEKICDIFMLQIFPA